MKTLEKEKAERHARKEENLRLSFKGNSVARNELVKKIIRANTVDKVSLSEFTQDIERLFAYPENYFKCETNYKALFILLETNGDEKLKTLTERFKNKLN